MAEVLVLSEADVAGVLDLEQLLAALADALARHSAGEASVPPRVAASAEGGILGAMPVHLPGVALGAKLVSVFPGNHQRGRPSHQALIALFDQADGTPLAVMDGTLITAARTGAAAAGAAGALARPDATVLAILGAGVQGRSHLEAFPLVREFGEIRVASRTPGHAGALAEGHPVARAVGSFEAAVAGADVVCCCTDTHDLQGLDPAAVTEIGEVLAGTRPGRTSRDELTVYKSTGHAVEDAAAAGLVYRRALATGTGTVVSI
ncbi:MAG TPA: ornithine cyclodeaminase family protein [Actinomycetota bacterium]